MRMRPPTSGQQIEKLEKGQRGSTRMDRAHRRGLRIDPES
jgi:hypothetical protein